MNDSIWRGTALPQFPALQGDIKTDVLVIGGGMAGLLCAYMLHHAGVQTVLIEQNRLCCGITGNTTAKITAQHGAIYHKLPKSKARLYAAAHMEATAEFKRLCAQIPCHFEEKSSFVYSLQDRQVLEKEAAVMQQIGMPADLLDTVPLPFSVAGAVELRQQGQFHPLEFAAGLVPELTIYEGTAAQRIDGQTVTTNHGTVTAEKIIVATHFPFLNTHGSYFLKLYQHRSYVLALENAPDVGGMYIGAEQNSLSLRNAGGLLLLGGGGHRTGKSGGGWRELRVFSRRHYHAAREVCRWATQDCMSLDGMPYIGQYSRHTPHLYAATGFNKWGMTGSMAAATILRELILGHEDPYEGLFSPSRSILRPQLAVNTVSAVGNLLRFSKPRCPHMGCALQWNPKEQSWDCPCHGSRFSESGKLLDNPATGDLRHI